MIVDLRKIQYILIALSFITFALIVLLFFLSNNKKNHKILELFNKIFNYLENTIIFRRRLYNLRTRIYNNTLDEELIIRYKVILYSIFSWIGGIVAAIIVLVLFSNNLYVTLTLLFLCYQIKEMFLDMLIGNDTPFLISLQEYGVELQQAFNLTKDVRTAIKEANNNSSNYNLVKRMEQVEKLFDDEIELELYLQDCPNDYLKLLILNCSLVAENGDKEDVDGKSVFLENIFYNNENIETEVFKRKQLEYWLRGLKLLSIIPLLAFSPYEAWVSKYMKVTDIFYKTTSGFLIKLAITVIAIIIFFIISGYEKSSRIKSRVQNDESWEDVLCKVKPFKDFVTALVPKYDSPRNYRYMKLISESGEYITIEQLFVQKVVAAIVGFFMIFAVTISVHQIHKSNLFNNIVISSELQSGIVATERGQEEIVNIENELFQYVNEDDLEESYVVIKEKLNEKGITKGENYLIKDIVSKKIKMDNESVGIVDVLISFVGVFLGYHFPQILLRFKSYYRKQEMENEIIIFETIILIYMYHEHGTPELILKTMAKFTDIFKPYIDNILKEMNRADFKALEILIADIKYKPFLNIVKNLIKAENIKTKDAFISLSSNRRNYLMNRKEENRKLVSKRVSNARALSLITINAIVAFYIALPLLHISSVQLDKTQKQIIQVEEQTDNNTNNKVMEE